MAGEVSKLENIPTARTSVPAERLRLRHLKGGPPERMQEYVSQDPNGAYEELLLQYQQVSQDHHLVEPAYQTLCQLWLTEDADVSSLNKLSELKRMRLSAFHLVPRHFLRQVVVDFPPEVN